MLFNNNLVGKILNYILEKLHNMSLMKGTNLCVCLFVFKLCREPFIQSTCVAADPRECSIAFGAIWTREPFRINKYACEGRAYVLPFDSELLKRRFCHHAGSIYVRDKCVETEL